jgi:hypothetical protein
VDPDGEWPYNKLSPTTFFCYIRVPSASNFQLNTSSIAHEESLYTNLIYVETFTRLLVQFTNLKRAIGNFVAGLLPQARKQWMQAEIWLKFDLMSPG